MWLSDILTKSPSKMLLISLNMRRNINVTEDIWWAKPVSSLCQLKGPPPMKVYLGAGKHQTPRIMKWRKKWKQAVKEISYETFHDVRHVPPPHIHPFIHCLWNSFLAPVPIDSQHSGQHFYFGAESVMMKKNLKTNGPCHGNAKEHE